MSALDWTAADWEAYTAGRLLLSMAEVARLLSVSERLVNELALTRQLPSVELGRRRLIRVRDLEAFLERRTVRAPVRVRR